MPSRRSREKENERDSSGSPERAIGEVGRKRKQRQPLSCAECRRLKLKCDRQVPCSNCVRRDCSELCPNDCRLPHKGNLEETMELKARLEVLERLLSDHLPNFSNLIGLDHSRNDRAPRERPELETSLTSSIGISSQQNHRGAASGTARESMNGHDGSAGTLTAFAGSQAMVEASTQPAFDMSIMLDQPLVFDFQTSPTKQTHQGQPSGSSASIRMGHATSPQDLGHGTLVMGKSGTSKWLGHTAASEWLKDQESDEVGDGSSPRPSRLPSPQPHLSNEQGIFPFHTAGKTTHTFTLLSGLPDIYETRVLVDSYFRYFSWSFDIAPKSTIERLVTEIYVVKNAVNPKYRAVDPQSLALIFIVLAVGSLHNLELAPNDPSAEEYLSLSKRCLAKSDFLTRSNIAGIQALHIMAHYHLATEKGRNGDSAWPLWGIATRLLQAMGLHRDGSKWNLDQETVEVRRRVFWECYSADVFQANCFSRPSSIAPQYIDTSFPLGPSDPGADPGLRHDLLKFELSKISAQVLDHAMRVDAPPYTSVLSLHDKLVHFERNIPYALRCRTVLLALPSMYPDSESAICASPELTRKDLRKTLQQFTLALNVSESLLFLNRPYFARALHERKPDPTQTEFGQSYLCVVERCNVMIQICAAIYPLHPGVISRHWFFWYHVFNAAVTMGTLILGDPRNMLASYALSLIDSAIGLYTNIIQSHSTTRLLRNLEWLLKLRQRASSRMATASSFQADYSSREPEEEDDVELIGWRTRLIQRLGKGNNLATTITPTQSAATPSPNTAMAQTISQALQKHFVPDNTACPPSNFDFMATNDQGTDMLLHQFWDPMMLQEQANASGDPAASVDWWNWEPSADNNQAV